MYNLDFLGIIYTAVTCGLILFLLVPLGLLLAKPRPRSGVTVFFRVIGFLLLFDFALVWLLFVLSFVPLLGLELNASGDALAFIFNGNELFSVPSCGGLIDIWQTSVGIALLGMPTLILLFDLLLSFLRRKKPALPVSADIVSPVGEKVIDAPALGTGTYITPQPVFEDKAETIQPQPVDIDEDELGRELVFDEEFSDLSEEIAMPNEQFDSAEQDEPIPLPPRVEVITQEHAPIVAQEVKTYKSSVQLPKARDTFRAKPSRPAAPKSAKAEPVQTQAPTPQPSRVERKSSGQTAPPPTHALSPTLPVTRRVVITNRANAVNVFSDYIREKEKNK